MLVGDRNEWTGRRYKRIYGDFEMSLPSQLDNFLPAALQTAPLPYGGFEHCTVCEHFPPVKR